MDDEVLFEGEKLRVTRTVVSAGEAIYSIAAISEVVLRRPIRAPLYLVAVVLTFGAVVNLIGGEFGYALTGGLIAAALWAAGVARRSRLTLRLGSRRVTALRSHDESTLVAARDAIARAVGGIGAGSAATPTNQSSVTAPPS
jgi:hypothetical protein